MTLETYMVIAMITLGFWLLMAGLVEGPGKEYDYLLMFVLSFMWPLLFTLMLLAIFVGICERLR